MSFHFLQDMYNNYRDFADYGEIFGIPARLKYQSTQEAWQANPFYEVQIANNNKLVKRKPTIYEIKAMLAISGNSPHFFTRSNMKGAGQRLRDFSVRHHIQDGCNGYLIEADDNGLHQITRKTRRFFNPIKKKLEQLKQ